MMEKCNGLVLGVQGRSIVPGMKTGIGVGWWEIDGKSLGLRYSRLPITNRIRTSERKRWQIREKETGSPQAETPYIEQGLPYIQLFNLLRGWEYRCGTEY